MTIKNDNRFYVYALLDPRKPGKYEYKNICFLYEPFYIGKGTKSRIRHHYYTRNLIPNTPKNQKIKKLFSLSLKPIEQKIYNKLKNKCALKIEEKLIIEIGRKDMGKGVLTNTTDGGEGWKNVSLITRKKLSDSHTGLKRSKEARKRMSEARMGMNFSKEHKKNLSISRKKRITTEETRQKTSLTSKGKINIRKFKLIDPDGKVYITKNGLTLFCEKHNLTASNLHKVVMGERKHHKGWKCEYY
jgi:hypothetical protein